MGDPGRGRQWRDSAEHRKAGVAAHPLAVVASGDEQLAGNLDANADPFEQLRVESSHDGLDQLIEHGDLIAEFEDAPSD
jgi:hypothetical protein